MFLLAEQMPYVFKIHMVSSAFALLLAPLVIAMRKQPETHRRLGRVLGAFVVVGGLTALPVAIFSHSPFAARAGFFVQGLVWLALLITAIIAIRKGERARHVRLMLAMVAVTTGAVWFRLMTGSAIYFQLPFEPIYSFAAWAGWIVPLVLVLYFPALARLFHLARSDSPAPSRPERA